MLNITENIFTSTILKVKFLTNGIRSAINNRELDTKTCVVLNTSASIVMINLSENVITKIKN